MPKKMTVDIIVVMCILVLIVGVGLLFFVGGVHELFIDPIVTPEPDTDRPLNIDISHPNEGARGQTLQMNISLENIGDEPVRDINITIAETESFEYVEHNIALIHALTPAEDQLKLKIKEDATLGENTGTLQIKTRQPENTATMDFKIEVTSAD